MLRPLTICVVCFIIIIQLFIYLFICWRRGEVRGECVFLLERGSKARVKNMRNVRLEATGKQVQYGMKGSGDNGERYRRGQMYRIVKV